MKEFSRALFLHVFGLNRLSSIFYRLLAMIIIQQMIAASSSFWIVDFVTKVKDGAGWQTPLILFLHSLILPYLPGSLALHFTNLWGLESQVTAFNMHIKNAKGRVELYNNEKVKNEQIVQMTRDLPQYISDFCTFSLQIISVAMNFVLQVLAVSFILGINFLISMWAGLVLMYAYVLVSRKVNKSLAFKKQSAQSDVSQILANSWENLTLNNTHNYKLWFADFNSRIENLKSATTGFSRFKEFGGGMISLIGFIPTLYFMYHSLWQGAPSVTELLAFSVLMPRIFQIFNMSTSAIMFINNINFLKGQWSAIADKQFHLDQAHDELAQRVNFANIHLRDNKSGALITFQNHDELFLWIKKAKAESGWFTFIGPNGSGKSSALLCIKQALAQEGYYLPASFNLSFQFLVKGATFSTGQKMNRAITEVAQSDTIRVLLLDEWDANLDHATMEHMTQKFRCLAEEKLIIDVSHRGS